MTDFYRKRRTHPLPDPPERVSTNWGQVANLLTQVHRQHPGRWTLIHSNAPNRTIASAWYLKTVTVLEGMEVESFARETGPKFSDRKTGWEIWLRKKPPKTETKEEA